MLRDQTFPASQPPLVLLDSAFFLDSRGQLDYSLLTYLRTSMQGRFYHLDMRLYTTVPSEVVLRRRDFATFLNIEDFTYYDFTDSSHIMRFIGLALISVALMHRGPIPPALAAIEPKFTKLSFEEFCGKVAACAQLSTFQPQF